VHDAPAVLAWRVGLAQTLLAIGKHDEARAELDVVARDDFSGMPDDPGRRYGLCGSADVAATVGDHERAVVLYDLLAPHAGLGVILGPTAYYGVADRYLGLLALALDRPDDAIVHLEAAVAAHDAFGACPWAARTRYDLARALLARNNDDDRARALGLLNDALDDAQEIGMPVLVDEVLPRKLDLQGIGSGSSPEASIDAVALSVSHARPNLRRHAAADGRVTIVFSDIQGYTALTERLGDTRSQEVLRAHNEILRRELTVHGGSEVKSHGDGFMLVFDDPVAAVRFALDFQRALAAHDFGDEVGLLRARVGVHVGEVIREGDDFFGRTVIVAARVAAAAGGDEVLVTEDVRAAVGGDVALDDGREVELKGLSGRHRVYAAGT
jgi:class 3 adenylate cyclase